MVNNAEICPVCGMSVIDAMHTVQYHKMEFQFCSAQCKETFMLNPTLYSSGFKENRMEIIKKCWLLLDQKNETMSLPRVENSLKSMMGVKTVLFDMPRLELAYDLMQTSLNQIIKELIKEDVCLDHGILSRMKRAWIIYKEKNEIDNMKRGSGACCNRPPPRTG